MMTMKVGRKKRPVGWLFLEDERKGAWGELFQARIHQALQPTMTPTVNPVILKRGWVHAAAALGGPRTGRLELGVGAVSLVRGCRVSTAEAMASLARWSDDLPHLPVFPVSSLVPKVSYGSRTSM